MTPNEPAGAGIRREDGIVYARRATGDLLMDLCLPAGRGPVPVVIWLHGGGWFTGDRTLAPDLAVHFASRGLAMASVDYRLSGQALFPAQLHDVRAAIRFLRNHAPGYGLDPAAIGLWGASAGGHLAALAGLTGHLASLSGEGDDGGAAASVRAVATSYAPVDLAAVVADAEANLPGMVAEDAPESRLLGGVPREHAELAGQANPLSWVTAAAPPFQISHGTGDVLVNHHQAERLHDALVDVGGTSALYLLEGYRHGYLNPAGRIDVDAARLMDDGRLASEGRAAAVHRSDAGPATSATSFGFDTVGDFLLRHLLDD